MLRTDDPHRQHESSQHHQFVNLLPDLRNWAHRRSDDTTPSETEAKRVLGKLTHVFSSNGRLVGGLAAAPYLWTLRAEDAERNAVPAMLVIGALEVLLTAVSSRETVWAEAIVVVAALLKHRRWRPILLINPIRWAEIVVSGLPTFRERECSVETTMLQMLKVLTGPTMPVPARSREAAEVAAEPLARIIIEWDLLTPQIIMVFAGYCRSRTFRVALGMHHGLAKVLRKLVRSLSSENLLVVLHSLRALSQLTDAIPTVRTLFTETNEQEANRVISAIIGNPASPATHVTAAVDLLRILLARATPGSSSASKQDMEALSAALKPMMERKGLDSQVFQLSTVLLEHGGLGYTLLPTLISCGIVTRAIASVTSVTGDDSMDEDELAIVHGSQVLLATLRTMHRDQNSVGQTEFDVMTDTFIPAIPRLVDHLTACLKEKPPSSPSSLFPFLEFVYTLLTFAPFEIDNGDLTGISMDELMTANCGDDIESAWGGSRIILQAIKTTVRIMAKVGNPAVDTTTVDCGALASVMINTASPVVVQACLQILAQESGGGGFAFSAAFCHARIRAETFEVPNLVARVPTTSEPLECEPTAPRRQEPTPNPEEDHPSFTEPTSASTSFLGSEPSSALVKQLETLSAALLSARENMQTELQLAADISNCKLAVLNERVRDLETIVEDKETVVRKATEELADATERTRKTIGDLQARLTTTTAAVEQARVREKDLESVVRERERELEDVKKSVNLTSRDLATTRAKLADTTAQLARLEASTLESNRLHRLRESELRSEISTLSRDFQSLQETSEAQGSTVSALEAQLEAAHVELAEEQRDHDEMISRLASSLNSSNGRRGRKGVVVVGGGPPGKPGENTSVGDLERMMKNL
ncbi:hypothetical protein HKX48_000576 [Thoreauomyces humboldtii]|nr:hypothetical protein HKX48_000576 [Thoreauomyces humboldtii]